MESLVVLLAIGYLFYLYFKKKQNKLDIRHIPEQFIVFDLETTGLSPERNEIIEIGAIRVNRDGDHHSTFSALVRPTRKIPTKITQLTGITQEMVDSKGEDLESAVREFLIFAGNLRLVSYNADFDMSFLRQAANRYALHVPNPVSCALKMSRRAWPGRKSYRLADISRDAKLNLQDTHRALGDCRRTATIYCAAASRLRSVD